MSISVNATKAGLSVSVSTGDYFGNRDEDVLSWDAIAERLRPLLVASETCSSFEHVDPVMAAAEHLADAVEKATTMVYGPSIIDALRDFREAQRRAKA